MKELSHGVNNLIARVFPEQTWCENLRMSGENFMKLIS